MEKKKIKRILLSAEEKKLIKWFESTKVFYENALLIQAC